MKQREGVVLILALLCILALEVSAAGLHYVTLQELRTARSAGRDAEMRLAARSAVARVLAAWPADLVENLPAHAPVAVPGAAVASVDGVSAEGRIERVGSNAMLITGTAISRLGETVRIGALVAIADPAVIASAFTAAVRTDGAITVHPGARITDQANGCPGAGQSSAIRMGRNAVLSNSGIVTGRVTTDSTHNRLDRIGSLDRATFAAAASTPDGSAAPLRYASRDTVIQFISGAGTLVIAGNADIRGGQFDGVIIVLGSASISGGTILNGSLIVDGDSLDLDNSTISFDACAILAAVSNPRFLGPFRPRGRMWIPLF